MTSSNSPIGNRPKDPFEEYYQIKELEAADEQRKKEEELASRSLLGFVFKVFSLLQKMIDHILLPRPKDISKSIKAKTKKSLSEMKKSFESLAREDRSQDIPFLKHLSETWQNLLEHSLQFKKMTPVAVHLKHFIKEIASYPIGADHSLAYYLSEYAGALWLPFPYMELIQKLHKLSEKDPLDHPLRHWIISIEKIIHLLNQE